MTYHRLATLAVLARTGRPRLPRGATTPWPEGGELICWGDLALGMHESMLPVPVEEAYDPG